MNSDDDRQDPSEWKDRIATQVSEDSYLEPLIGESKKIYFDFEFKDEAITKRQLLSNRKFVVAFTVFCYRLSFVIFPASFPETCKSTKSGNMATERSKAFMEANKKWP